MIFQKDKKMEMKLGEAIVLLNTPDDELDENSKELKRKIEKALSQAEKEYEIMQSNAKIIEDFMKKKEEFDKKRHDGLFEILQLSKKLTDRENFDETKNNILSKLEEFKTISQKSLEELEKMEEKLKRTENV